MSCNCKGGCPVSKTAFVLVIIGALNWGFVGIGMLISSSTNLNLVNLVFGSWPVVEAIIYILVGISALVKIFGCPCKKCKESCANCKVPMDAGMNKEMKM